MRVLRDVHDLALGDVGLVKVERRRQPRIGLGMDEVVDVEERDKADGVVELPQSSFIVATRPRFSRVHTTMRGSAAAKARSTPSVPSVEPSSITYASQSACVWP